jgi:hypothetical protein
MQIAKSLDVHSVELHRSPPTMVQASVPFLVLPGTAAIRFKCA